MSIPDLMSAELERLELAAIGLLQRQGVENAFDVVRPVVFRIHAQAEQFPTLLLPDLLAGMVVKMYESSDHESVLTAKLLLEMCPDQSPSSVACRIKVICNHLRSTYSRRDLRRIAGLFDTLNKVKGHDIESAMRIFEIETIGYLIDEGGATIGGEDVEFLLSAVADVLDAWRDMKCYSELVAKTNKERDWVSSSDRFDSLVGAYLGDVSKRSIGWFTHQAMERSLSSHAGDPDQITRQQIKGITDYLRFMQGLMLNKTALAGWEEAINLLQVFKGRNLAMYLEFLKKLAVQPEFLKASGVAQAERTNFSAGMAMAAGFSLDLLTPTLHAERCDELTALPA